MDGIWQTIKLKQVNKMTLEFEIETKKFVNDGGFQLCAAYLLDKDGEHLQFLSVLRNTAPDYINQLIKECRSFSDRLECECSITMVEEQWIKYYAKHVIMDAVL